MFPYLNLTYCLLIQNLPYVCELAATFCLVFRILRNWKWMTWHRLSYFIHLVGKHENVTWKIAVLLEKVSKQRWISEKDKKEKPFSATKTKTTESKHFGTNVFYACLYFSSISLAQVGCWLNVSGTFWSAPTLHAYLLFVIFLSTGNICVSFFSTLNVNSFPLVAVSE